MFATLLGIVLAVNGGLYIGTIAYSAHKSAIIEKIAEPKGL